MNRLLLEPPPTLSDERLAKLSADGIDSAFAMIVLRHRRTLVCHCAELVGQADAEEVVQETLLRAYLALARGESVNHVGPWLRTIAHNAAVNLLRARAARPAISSHEPEPELIAGDTFERRESLREVVRALEELPERQRQALVMRELEGRSYAEIEARLKASNGAVRQLLNRARATVRDRFDAVAGLIPAFRWIFGDGGGAATAARLGALSGGCAVTIKLCTATLPAVLVPAATSPKPSSPDHHGATLPSRAVEGTAALERARSHSTRAAPGSRARLDSMTTRQFSAPRPTAAGMSASASASQPPGTQAWGHHASHTEAEGPAPTAGRPNATESAGGGAATPGWSAGGSPRPLQMSPNVPSVSTTASGNPGSTPGNNAVSTPSKGWGPTTGESSGSPMPGANQMAQRSGSGGAPGQPQPGRGRN